MPFAAAAAAAAVVVGSVVQSNAAADSAKDTRRANEAAAAAGEASTQAANDRRQPFTDIGLTAGEKIQDLINNPNAGLEEINPVVSFLRDEGFEDVQESAAAGNRLGAGGTLNDLVQFNSDLTSTVAPQLRSQKFNELFNLLTLGSNSASGQATATINEGVNRQNLLTNTGVAQGNATIQQGNAVTGAIDQASELAGFVTNPPPATTTPSFNGGFSL